ncbi:MAG: addiction module toxin RelE [Clostridiales bacterium 38-18]|nr:MAG: addiction module toxin RelE [Clostridiales bacterium 38-18]
MYTLEFFYNDNEESEVLNLLLELKEKKETSKDARLNYEKIILYLEILSQKGTRAGVPYTDYIGDGIWELRPLRNRILFVLVEGNKILLLHHFIKDTKKTPQREINQAKKNLKIYNMRKEE